jgi:hypothetical protein
MGSSVGSNYIKKGGIKVTSWIEFSCTQKQKKKRREMIKRRRVNECEKRERKRRE